MSLCTVKTPLLPLQILRITICGRGDARPLQAPGSGKGRAVASPQRGEGLFLAATLGTVTGASHGATGDNFPSIQLSDGPGTQFMPREWAGLLCQHRLLPGTMLPGDTSVQLPALVFCSHILRSALQGAITLLEGTCPNPPVRGNPTYCSPEKPCLSDLGKQQAPPVWFLNRYPEANPQSAADPQLVFSLIYVRAYLCPLLKTIQFVSAVNGTVYHPAAVWLLPEMSFTPVLIKQKSF